MKKIKPKHLSQVEAKVCEVFGIERSRLFEKTKQPSIVSARRVLLYILLDRGYTHAGLVKRYDIRRSATYHAVSFIPAYIKHDKNLGVKYKEVVKMIRGLR